MQALFVSPPFQLSHIFLDGDWPTFSSLQTVNFVINLQKKATHIRNVSHFTQNYCLWNSVLILCFSIFIPFDLSNKENTFPFRRTTRTVPMHSHVCGSLCTTFFHVFLVHMDTSLYHILHAYYFIINNVGLMKTNPICLVFFKSLVEESRVIDSTSMSFLEEREAWKNEFLDILYFIVSLCLTLSLSLSLSKFLSTHLNIFNIYFIYLGLFGPIYNYNKAWQWPVAKHCRIWKC